MKKYFYLVATLLLTVTMTLPAQNYGRRGGRGGNRRADMNKRSEYMMKLTPQERVDLMTKELNLTADEATKVLALFEKNEAERIADVRENRSQRGMGTANRDTRREEFRAYRAEEMRKNQEELAEIIGKERADKWYEIRQDVRDYNRAGRMDGDRGYYRDNKTGINNRRYDNDRRYYDTTRRSDYMIRLTPQERVDLMTKELDLTAEQAAKILELSEKQEAERNAQVDAHRSNRGSGTIDRTARREEFRALRDKQMKEHQEELVKIIGQDKVDQWNEIRQNVRDENRAGRRNPRFQNR